VSHHGHGIQSLEGGPQGWHGTNVESHSRLIAVGDVEGKVGPHFIWSVEDAQNPMRAYAGPIKGIGQGAGFALATSSQRRGDDMEDEWGAG
jgi:hypothetical protein